MTKIEDNALVLFQGDGITDHARDEENLADLGCGYVLMAASWFSALYPQKGVSFINRGLRGSRIKDLGQRWEKDCLTLAPAWVSIQIGVNNTRRRFDRDDPTPIDDFERDYRALLQQTRERLNPKLVILEPFIVPSNEEQHTWRADLEEKIAVVRDLAGEFNAIYIPLDTIFAEAARQRDVNFWLLDGVLVKPPGAALIAQSWLKAVDAL